MSRTAMMWIAAVTLTLVVSTGCGDGDGGGGSTAPTGGDDAELVIYSGRDEELIGPLIDRFEEESGIRTQVRYGNSAEMGAALLEEGGNTPADLFYSQEVGAIGVLDTAGLLSPLPTDVVEKVDSRFRPRQGSNWVGVTGRSRVLVVNPDLVAEMPKSVEDLTDPMYRSKVAWAPSNASFQAFITAFRVSEGEQAASDWLDAMIENDTQLYDNNVDILEAVNSGEIGVGLINHYYWARMASEVGGPENMDAELVFPTGEDPGALVNATAVAITENGSDNPAALEFVRFLLSEEGQRYFEEETKEYPLVAGVPSPAGVPPLDELQGPDLDLTDLESLEQTITLLTDKGLLG